MKGKKVLLLISLSFLMIPNVKASTCSVSTNKTSITVGETVTISVTGQDAIGKFNVSAPSILSPTNTSLWIENSTGQVSFTANSSGTATINVSPERGLSNGNGDEINIGCNSINIVVNPKSSPKPNNVTPQPNISNNSTKSNNNYLKSFGIDGYNLSEEFNKDINDYTVTVPYDTTEIKIVLEKEDDKATISGDDGVKTVSLGENKFTTTVIAENGEQRNYTINVIVEEKPVIVKIGNDEYSLITKEEELPKLTIEHDIITLNIQDTEVKAYRIDSISYVLVGLKDKKNNIKLYKFDSFKDEVKPPKYELFQYINISDIYLVLKEPQDIPESYKKVSIKINGNEITSYQKDKDFYLIYGLNLNSGNESFYIYDKVEETIQRYNKDELNDINLENENLKKILLLTGSLLIISFIIILILIFKKTGNKENKRIKDLENKELEKEIIESKKMYRKQKKEDKRILKELKKEEKLNKRKQKDDE